MGKRREARERAIQFLFQHDLNPEEDLESALNMFWEGRHLNSLPEDKRIEALEQGLPLPPPSAEEASTRLFADTLIRGTLQHRDEIDAALRRVVKNWEIHRIAAVDRNILRLAIHEMLHRDDIPPVVSINEAVDIAKRFSTEESGKFVNGILDRIRAEVPRPARS
ncbi:MAG: transcription antitermination factor NusB [Verrucomicrobiota bacterium]|jgi:N utilization substance protein B